MKFCTNLMNENFMGKSPEKFFIFLFFAFIFFLSFTSDLLNSKTKNYCSKELIPLVF